MMRVCFICVESEQVGLWRAEGPKRNPTLLQQTREHGSLLRQVQNQARDGAPTGARGAERVSVGYKRHLESLTNIPGDTTICVLRVFSKG